MCIDLFAKESTIVKSNGTYIYFSCILKCNIGINAFVLEFFTHKTNIFRMSMYILLESWTIIALLAYYVSH